VRNNYKTKFEKEIFEKVSRRTRKSNINASDFTLAEELILKKDLLKRASQILSLDDREVVNASEEIDNKIKPHYKEGEYGGLLYTKTKHGYELQESYRLMRKITVDVLKGLGYGKQVNNPKFWLELAAKELNLNEETKKYAEDRLQKISEGSPSVRAATVLYLAKRDLGLRFPTQYDIAKAVYVKEASIMRMIRALKCSK
jgi:hypothetical protein